MARGLRIYSLVVIVFVISGCAIWQKKVEPATENINTIAAGEVAVFSSDVVVYQPLSNDAVPETFTVSGRVTDAVATVLISVIDAQKVLFATTTLQTNAGYFSGTVTALAPPTNAGELVVTTLRTDGSTGSSISVLVLFSSYQGKTISLYFSNIIKDPELKNCGQVYPVTRDISIASGTERSALINLIIGPTDAEVAQGYITNFPEAGIVINKIALAGNTYTVDFNSKIQAGVSGDCRLQALRAQIEQTLKQFSTSSAVIITVDGQSGIFKPER